MTVEEILNHPDLDAVTVECDEVLQTKYALMIAEKGIPLHWEKPDSESEADFDRLIDIISKKNLPFQMGYMYRYNPAVLKLYEDIESGKLGEIYAVEAQMSCPYNDWVRNWENNFKGGIMYYLDCHLVDIIYKVMGEPEEILSLNCPTHINDIDSNDYGFAVFKYKNGISFAKTCSSEIGGFQRRQIVVAGSKGTVELNPIERYVDGEWMVTDIHEKFDLVWRDEHPSYSTEPFDRYDAMMRGFAEIVRGERINSYTPEYEQNLHKIILMTCGFKRDDLV